MAWSIFDQGGGEAAARSWAQQFLSMIGAPVTPENVSFVYDWEKRSTGGGKYNPLDLPAVSGHPELTTGSASRLSLGAVQNYVAGYANQLASMFGIKTAGGWRKSDPFPDHPSGHAVDFMITDLGTKGVAEKNPQGKAIGDALADYIVANYKALGVKYIIWNHRTWNPSKGWHPYTQAGQGPHNDHVHVTWNDSPGTASYAAAADYASWEAGLQGAKLQLQSQAYQPVLNALQNGNPTAATSALNSISGGNPLFSNVANFSNTASADSPQCAWTLKSPVGTTCVISKVNLRHVFGITVIAGGTVVALIGITILVAFGLSDKAVGMIPGGSAVKNVVGNVL